MPLDTPAAKRDPSEDADVPDAPPRERNSYVAPRPTARIIATGLRVSETLVMNVVWCAAAAAPPLLPADVVARVLTPTELLEATVDPALDLEPGFVPSALDKGDLCVGVFVGPQLASYGFYAERATDVAFGLRVAWADPRVRYMYKGFTLPSHRGRGLYSLGLSAAAWELGGRGVRQIFAFIRRGNDASLGAALRAGYRVRGTFVGTGLFGGRGYLSTSPRARGLRIVRAT